MLQFKLLFTLSEFLNQLRGPMGILWTIGGNGSRYLKLDLPAAACLPYVVLRLQSFTRCDLVSKGDLVFSFNLLCLQNSTNVAWVSFRKHTCVVI